MQSPPTGIPYLRVSRSLRGWYRPIGEILLATIGWAVAAGIATAIVFRFAHVKKLKDLGIVGEISTVHVILALMIPAALVSAHIMGRRPGLLASVRVRMRWGWLARCVLYAVVGQALFVGFIVIAAVVSDEGLSGHFRIGTNTAALIVSTLLLVPFQAAGEEFFNRGTLQQAVGAYGAPRWLAMGLSTAAFVAMHGAIHVGTIAIAVMGLLFAWLTLETGGLEAAIAAHATNNVVAFSLSAVAHGGRRFDDLKDMNAGVGLTSVIVQLGTLAVFTALVTRGWKRAGLSAYANPEDIPRNRSAQRAFPVANQIEQHAPERSVSVEHADDGGDAEPLPPEQQ